MANKTLAFEIGTEELPAFALHNATEKLSELAAAALDGAKVPHGGISVYSTPRRLIVIIADVPPRSRSTRTASPPRPHSASHAARESMHLRSSAATRTASSTCTP